MDNEEIINFLKMGGMNLYEAKIYLSLLKYGRVSKSEIYKLANIPQSRVYDILISLIKKDLVKPSNQSIIPEHPRKIINSNVYVKNKDKLRVLQKKLEQEFNLINKKISILNNERNIFNYLEGLYDSPLTQHPIINRFLLLFENSKKDILCCTTLPILYPSGQFYDAVLRAVERGVSYRRILGFDYVMAQGERSILRDEKKGIVIRVIPESKIEERYYVVDNSHVFLRAVKTTIDSENEEAFIFDQNDVVSSYKKNFEKLWNSGEELDLFLGRIKSKILLSRGYKDILFHVFENGRTNKEDLTRKFKNLEIEFDELINKGVLKNSEVKGMLIIDIFTLLRSE